MTQADIQLFDPQTLYRRWEDSQWNPFEIDLRRDKEQWAGLAREDRDLIHWVLAQLMVAEERITTKFSGLVGAYGSARRRRRFSRRSRSTRRGTCSSTRASRTRSSPSLPPSARMSSGPAHEVIPAFRKLFDEALVQAHERLVAAPRTWPRRSAS